MINITYVIPTLDQSGAEKQLMLLATGLPRDRFNPQVICLTRGGPYATELAQSGIKTVVLNKRLKLDPWAMYRLSQEIHQAQPHIVHSWLFAANSYLRLVTGGKPEYKRVISERCVDSWKSGWQLWLDKKLISRTDCLLGNSQSVCDFYAELGYPRDKMQVIFNGIPAVKAEPVNKAEFLKSCQLPENAILVACIGRLAPQKRIKDLIWSIQMLRQLDPRCYLLIIGDGPLRTELELHARDLECIKHVRFLGHRHDVKNLLPMFDLFWLASEFEGQSNSLLEAMQAGIPVIVSDIPPNREVVTHGVNGYTVKLGDSPGWTQYSFKILNEPELGKTLSENAQILIQQSFSVETMVNQHIQVYEKLLA